MTIQSQADIDALKRVGAIVSSVLKTMLDSIEPGMTTAELNAIGARLLAEKGARSAPQVMYNFPAATCISVNEEAAHGIPGKRRIEAGDLVNVDVSAELDGYFADTGGTRVVPPATQLKTRLCHATRMALDAALSEARAGQRINQIGKAIERTAKAHGFKTIKNLAGHGIGRSLHEEPDGIVSYYDPRDTRVLREGMVIAIEPFLSTKSTVVHETDDGWTLAAAGNLSAQYEHTIIVTRGAPIIVTTH
ncbi:MAG TPA: type I methionyl aminopeptidase [Steroidobacteraceae bacterium]|nr:type I methionyl aminopeptidase [Steroidobacteraceae bacterium]